jgi:hypothetical protein
MNNDRPLLRQSRKQRDDILFAESLERTRGMKRYVLELAERQALCGVDQRLELRFAERRKLNSRELRTFLQCHPFAEVALRESTTRESDWTHDHFS